MNNDFDVIVVGAGLSGLVCATRLAAAGKSVVVLEARDRVGGRLHSVPFANTTIDLGGTWMSVGQPRLAALATELGSATFPQSRDGAPLFLLDDRGPFARIASAFARWRASRRIKQLARNPPADASTLSLGDYLARNVRHPSARALVAMHAELVFAVDPASLSLAHYLKTFSTTGGFSPAGPDLPGGAREHRFAGGAQSLALALAARLPASSLMLSSPVLAITQNATSVTARTAASSFTARHLVLALPPSLARTIEIDLPDTNRAAASASQLGAVVKCFVAYAAPFWRDAKLSGEAFRPYGIVRATVALEPPPLEASLISGTLSDTGQPNPPSSILLAFVVGPHARDWHTRDPDERREDVIVALVEQFGNLAASYLEYVEVDWSTDPWSTGCVASMPPSSIDAAAWRASFGRIHIAGTEAATEWSGYMEGAIEAGERAATDIVRDAADT